MRAIKTSYKLSKLSDCLISPQLFLGLSLSHGNDCIDNGHREKERFLVETMCRLEEMFGVPFYRGATSMISYYVREKEYEKASECFEEYVERMLYAEEI